MRMVKKVYLYFVMIPDRWYPFANKIEGEWVRGRRSYELAVRRAIRRNGLSRLGYKLMFYRQTFHFIGSILAIVSATYLSNNFFGSEVALYMLLSGVILALFIQEFYLHPRMFGQRNGKGVIDMFAWVAPIAAYFFLFM